MNALKTDSINKNVLLVIALLSVVLAAWMMASRNEALHQLQRLQAAQDGAQLRIQELTDKLTEKDLEVEKVAKLSAEEAVKKIINIPELDKILGIKASNVLGAPPTSPPNVSAEQPSSSSNTQSSSTTVEIPAAIEQLPSSEADLVGKSGDIPSAKVETSDQTSSIPSPPLDPASSEGGTSSVPEPSSSSLQMSVPDTNSKDPASSEGSNNTP